MTYFDGYEAAVIHLDAKCGKGWEGVKGKCKRIKPSKEPISSSRAAQQIEKMMAPSIGDRLRKSSALSRIGLAAFIVASSYVAYSGLNAAMNKAIPSISKNLGERKTRAALTSALNGRQSQDPMQEKLADAKWRDTLRTELTKMEENRSRRSSIKHEQQLKDFFSNVSELAGGEKEVMKANNELLNKIAKMQPNEVDKFFEQKRNEYEKLMGGE